MADLINGRENWGSRGGFILAAVGSAVGLGNVWRFPHEVYKNGGGAFLVPYIVAMVVIGLPLLIMEFSLGHLTQQAAPNAFKHIGKRWEFVGWWPIVLSFVIVTYYAVVLAWCVNFLIESCGQSLPWAAGGAPDAAKNHFFVTYLESNDSFALGGLRWPIVGALAAVWTAMYLCLFRGVKLVSKIVLWTVPIPWLMLIILTVRGLTLEGAVLGLEYYLEPDWSVLKDPHIWRAAFGQVFFSMTLAFGVMVTYASFLHRKSDLNNNALIIGLADLGTSFVAGLAVFATMGAMAYATNQPVAEVLESSKSIGLAFVAFPQALGALPMANVFSAIFFIALLLLGIDSAFSITEASLASLIDKTGWKRRSVLLGLSVVGFGVGLIFTTRGGLTWLDTIDGIVTEGTWGILFLGLVQCLVVGWVFDIGKLRQHANHNSDWKLGVWWEWSIRVVIPLMLGGLVVWSLVGDIKGPSMLLGGGDFKHKNNVSLIAVKLRDSDDLVSQYLRTRLSAQTQQILAAYDDSSPGGWSKTEKALAADLNTVLEGAPIYDKDRFGGVRIPAGTWGLMESKDAEKHALRINRLLLQEAFPDEIEATKNVGGFLVDIHGNLVGRNVFSLCLTFIFFLVAVVVALWRPKEVG